MSKTKAYKSARPPENLILISVFYQLIMFLGEYVLLGGLDIRYEFLDVSGVGNKFEGLIYGGDFILYDRHE